MKDWHYVLIAVVVVVVGYKVWWAARAKVGKAEWSARIDEITRNREKRAAEAASAARARLEDQGPKKSPFGFAAGPRKPSPSVTQMTPGPMTSSPHLPPMGLPPNTWGASNVSGGQATAMGGF